MTRTVNKKFKVFWGILMLIMLLLFGTVLELWNRYTHWGQVSFFRDVDHRLPSNTDETNADGIRCQKDAEDFQPGDLNIIVLGDSFVYSLYVPRQLAVPQQFEALAAARHPDIPINVANFGWISSSPYLSLRLLKDIGAKYHPDVIFLCIDMTDFHDDLVYSSILERPKIIYTALHRLPGLTLLLKDNLERFIHYEFIDSLYEHLFGVPYDRYFLMHRPLEHTTIYTHRIIESINNTYTYATDTLHAKFILTIFPRSFQYRRSDDPQKQEAGAYEVMGPYVYEPFKLFEQLQPDVPYPIYSLLQHFLDTDVFPTCFPDDPHWNADGCRVAAEGLYNIARQEQIF